MQILEVLASAEGPASLQQIAERLDASKSSVFPIVRTLVTLGYLEAVEPAGYRITEKTAKLHDVRVSQQALVASLGDAVILQGGIQSDSALVSVLRASRVVCIASEIDSKRVAPISIPVGTTLPPHATASGKVMLASLSNEAVHVLLRSAQLPRYTDKTIHHLADLIDELEIVRQRGWADSWEELDRGIAGVAVPIRTETSGTVAALELMSPIHRAEPERWQATRQQAQSLAAEISAKLGPSR